MKGSRVLIEKCASKARLPSSSFTPIARPITTNTIIRRNHNLKSYPNTRKIVDPKAASPFTDLKTPHPILASTTEIGTTTKVTTLPNGVKVISEDAIGSSATVGVFLSCGSSDLPEDKVGAFHLVERMAFKTTKNRTVQQMVAEVEELGGMGIATTTREYTLYFIDCLRDKVDTALELVIDSTFNCKYEEEEVEEQKQVVQIQYQDQGNEPSQLILEKLHEVGFGKKGLGLAIFGDEAVQSLSAQTLKDIAARYFVGSRVAIAGVGVDHDQLVSLASQHLSLLPSHHPDVPALPSVDPEYSDNIKDSFDRDNSQEWVGGHFVLPEIPRTLAVPPNFRPQTHIGLAFKGPSIYGDSLYAVSILTTLLGGGGSFSAGGPGKGLFSRFYSNILCGYGFVESVNALAIAYSKTGLFAVLGSCTPGKEEDYLYVVLQELLDTTVSLTEEQVNRAKNMLKSNILSSLESKSIRFEDMSRQILAYGRRKSVEEQLEAIDKVTLEDVSMVAMKCLLSKPAIIVYGDQPPIKMPKWQKINDYVAKGQTIIANIVKDKEAAKIEREREAENTTQEVEAKDSKPIEKETAKKEKETVKFDAKPKGIIGKIKNWF